jgi:uncharacterized membrane protein SpoIIM required for sporulation
MTPAKLSILFLYRRIVTSNTFHRVTTAVIVIVLAWCIGCLVPHILQCRPIPAAWNTSIHGDCLDMPKLFLAGTIANLLTDVLILCLPLRNVWNLNMSRCDRLTVSGMFLVGGIVCVAALLRVTVQIGMNLVNPTGKSSLH